LCVRLWRFWDAKTGEQRISDQDAIDRRHRTIGTRVASGGYSLGLEFLTVQRRWEYEVEVHGALYDGAASEEVGVVY
jgi:hypothetical protein